MGHPRLGIVTPSFNQASYITQTIESVLEAKTCLPIAYAVIDGGSTDGTVEIIQKYEKYLDFWVSEPDGGQSNAINKGLRKLDFDVWSYLNSDDYYLDGALETVLDCFAATGADWVTGTGRYFTGAGKPEREMIPVEDWTKEDVIRGLAHSPIVVASQVSNFMSRRMLDRFGYFDESLHYTMDIEFGIRLVLSGIRPVILPQVLGMARLHEDSKTVSKGKVAFPREFECFLRSLDLSEQPELESVREEAILCLARRNALNRFWADGTGTGAAMREVYYHLKRHPSDFANREIMGAVRRRLFN